MFDISELSIVLMIFCSCCQRSWAVVSVVAEDRVHSTTCSEAESQSPPQPGQNRWMQLRWTMFMLPPPPMSHLRSLQPPCLSQISQNRFRQGFRVARKTTISELKDRTLETFLRYYMIQSLIRHSIFFFHNSCSSFLCFWNVRIDLQPRFMQHQVVDLLWDTCLVMVAMANDIPITTIDS